MFDACTQPVSALKNSLSEKPRFLLVENDFRDQDVSMRCTHFYWSAISSCTFWQTELGTMYMCINTHITCVHTHKYYILTAPMKWKYEIVLEVSICSFVNLFLHLCLDESHLWVDSCISRWFLQVPTFYLLFYFPFLFRFQRLHLS